MPKYKYSNYNDVRRVPADFLSALSVCDDVRKSRLIAAVWNLLEADRLYLSAEELKLKVNSDYIYNVLPHLFICAVQMCIRDRSLTIQTKGVDSGVYDVHFQIFSKEGYRLIKSLKVTVSE